MQISYSDNNVLITKDEQKLILTKDELAFIVNSAIKNNGVEIKLN